MAPDANFMFASRWFQQLLLFLIDNLSFKYFLLLKNMHQNKCSTRNSIALYVHTFSLMSALYIDSRLSVLDAPYG